MKHTITRRHAILALLSALAIGIIADRCMTAIVYSADIDASGWMSAVMNAYTPLLWFALFWLLTSIVVIAQFFQNVLKHKQNRFVQIEFAVCAALTVLLCTAVLRESVRLEYAADASAIHGMVSICIVLPALVVMLVQIPTAHINIYQLQHGFVVWLRGCFIDPFAHVACGLRSIRSARSTSSAYGLSAYSADTSAVKAAKAAKTVEVAEAAKVSEAAESTKESESTKVAESDEVTEAVETTAVEDSAAVRADVLGKSHTRRAMYREVCVGIGMLVPVVLVLLPLLMQADDVFYFTVQQVLYDIDLTIIVWHMIAILCVSLLSFSVFVGSWRRIEQCSTRNDGDSDTDRIMDAHKVDVNDIEALLSYTVTSNGTGIPVTTQVPVKTHTYSAISTAIMLAGVVALYSVFLAIQARTVLLGIVLGAGIQLPDGLTYAEYARSGFFQTLAAVIINLVLFGLVIQYCAINTIVRRLVIAVIACSMTMTVSAALRLGLYINAYGLTLLRLEAATYIPVIAVMLVLALVRLYTKRIPVIVVSLLLILIWWIVLGMLHPSELITVYNMNNGYAW